MTKSELAKVFVERDENTFFGLGTRNDLRITAAWRIGSHPSYIVSALPQSNNCISRKVLISQDAHTLRFWYREGIHLFSL